MSKPPSKSLDAKIWIESIYGVETRKGLVNLSFGDKIISLSPEEAREVATILLEAAEAARSDESVVSFIEKINERKMTTEEIGAILHTFRQMREGEGEKP